MELPRTLNRAERICRTYRHIRPSALQPHSGVFVLMPAGAAGRMRFYRPDVPYSTWNRPGKKPRSVSMGYHTDVCVCNRGGLCVFIFV